MQASSVEGLSDQELYDLIVNRKKESAMRIPVPAFLQGFARPTTWMITHDTVLKQTSSPTEAFIMDYVASRTTIPIPKCHRVFPHETLPHLRYLVMDYIEGDRLDVLWPSMSWWEKTRVLWTLHGYMRQLHSVPLLNPGVPGPFDASGKSYLCRGMHFTEDGAGPFTDYSDMAAWFDRRRYQVLACAHADGLPLRSSDYPKFDTSYPLVLCHMDLGMRNVLVDKGGKLWLIDWEMSGAYPAWVEYAQCASWEHAFRHELQPPQDWVQAAKYLIGDYRWHLDSYLTPLAYGLRSSSNIDLCPSDYFEKLGLDIDSL